MDGGIIRYYAIDAKEELYKKLAELRRTEGEDAIDCCGIEYIGDLHLNLWAAGGANAYDRIDVDNFYPFKTEQRFGSVFIMDICSFE